MKHLRTLATIADIAQSGSIRRTAERLNITPSALTRKIQEFEAELGVPIFERLPQGMRLNSAGELVVQHVRAQTADLARVRSHIADLQGIRRGHVAIGASQAFIHQELPDAIELYRRQHPEVGFTVQIRDHAHAITALVTYEVDLVLVLDPPPAPELRPLLTYPLPLCAMMAATHPLAGSAPVRLRECLRYPVAMPDRSLAVRHLLDAALLRTSNAIHVAVESGSLEFLRNYVRREAAISFQVTSGIPKDETSLCAREIDHRDVAGMNAVLGHLHGRTLSIAAAKFADQIAGSLYRRHGQDSSAR
jgi:DNA-binding transcriptional LysR family regulator